MISTEAIRTKIKDATEKNMSKDRHRAFLFELLRDLAALEIQTTPFPEEKKH